jgi:hypothetical protein
MKKLNFWVLITFGALVGLQSCVRENISDEKTVLQEKTINEKVDARSSSVAEQSFRQALRDLIDLYDDANTASTGALSTLLDNIGDDPHEDALEELDGSGLINMTLLESTIADATTYEALLIQEQSVSYVNAVIAEEIGTISERSGRPFWGKRKTSLGIVGGIGGAPCHEMYFETTYRFWINWGSSDPQTGPPIPCP